MSMKWPCGELLLPGGRGGQEDDIPINQEELQIRGVGQLSLREINYAMKAKPKGHLVAKVTVLLFPGALSDLDNLCDATQSPSWPGIKVWEAKCPFHSEDSTGHVGVPHLTHHHPRDSLCPTCHWQRPLAHGKSGGPYKSLNKGGALGEDHQGPHQPDDAAATYCMADNKTARSRAG
jgi:hypothetical protein